MEPEQESILNLMQLKSQTFGEHTALSIRKRGVWETCSYLELSRRSNQLSDFLREQDACRGDRIAIWGESCPEWVISFFGGVRSGGVIVPLDIRSTSSEILAIVQDAQPHFLLASDSVRVDVELLQAAVPNLRKCWYFSQFEDLQPSNTIEGVEREMNEPCLLAYTSGTTGSAKGVIISFGNIVFQVRMLTDMVGISRDDVFLSILPLNHLLELTGGLFCVVYTGGEVCYGQTFYPQEVLQIMKEKPITWMVTVPLFLKVLKSYLEKTGEKLPAHMKGFICGGARLSQEIAEFFEQQNAPVLQGYGLTETSPVISVNSRHFNKAGSVGKPLPRTEVKIAEDGEILARGPHVMKGYYKREDWTREVIDSEGWLHTGDLGEFDSDGFLYITGRLKNMIVLGDGKKVHPEEVESALEKSTLWKEICVSSCLSKKNILEGTEEVCAVVVQPASGERDVLDEIDRLTAGLAPYKKPARILFRQEEFPRTSTRKIKRHLVREWIQAQVESVKSV
jgi:long-chain acyl-CoA synthetase